MRTIWKFPFRIDDTVSLQMPRHTWVLKVDMQQSPLQSETPCIWGLVQNTDEPLETRTFKIYGTGHEVPTGQRLDYIDTFQSHSGVMVWHMFEIGAEIS